MQLAFPTNTHQNANQKPIGSVLYTGHSVHFHPSRFTRPSFSIFRGSVPRLSTHTHDLNHAHPLITIFEPKIIPLPEMKLLQGECRIL